MFSVICLMKPILLKDVPEYPTSINIEYFGYDKEFNRRFNKSTSEIRNKFKDYILTENNVVEHRYTDKDESFFDTWNCKVNGMFYEKVCFYYEEVSYYEGYTRIFKNRLFKNKLFKVGSPCYFATNKRAARKLLDKFIKINKKSDPKNLQIYHEILDKFEEGMILELF